MNTKRVLIIAPRMPEFDRESGSRRIFDVIEFFIEAGWTVTFAAKTISGGERYIKILQQRGVETFSCSDERLLQSIVNGNFDLGYFAFWCIAEEYLPLIRKHSPLTRVIVDSIDLHFLRNSRAIFSHKTAEANGLLNSSYADEFIREVNAYAAADTVLTVSSKETEWINDLVGDNSLSRPVPDNEDISAEPDGFEKRKGILFIGNFWHRPNVDAVRYLCEEILPQVNKRILDENPVYVVGHAMTPEISDFGKNLPNVRFIGWVPSVLPYIRRAKVSVMPLRYGAGTKRKIVQSLMVGTPIVTTSIGAEGMRLINNQHALISDDSREFARYIEILSEDEELWERLRTQGREIVVATHGRKVVKDVFFRVIEETLDKNPKLLIEASIEKPNENQTEEYPLLISRIRNIVKKIIPAGTSVIVISKGDNELLKLNNRQGMHFPQASTGEYAGYNPANSTEIIDHLEDLKSKGGKYLLFPQTAFWWLEYYSDFKKHLDTTYKKAWEDLNCVIYELSSRDLMEEKLNGQSKVLSSEFINQIRPIGRKVSNGNLNGSKHKPKVLVLGIYLANQQNNAEDIVDILSDSENYSVTQRWVSIGGEASSKKLADITVNTLYQKVPKFEILNNLLAEEDNLESYDYILISDDDIILPKDFLNQYLTAQTKLGFVLAQPARTNDSYLDHPIVEQQWGVLARQTQFVEIGPVFSFHKSVYELILPFDLTSPMGWGYENIWAQQLAARKLKMGIIDAFPVAHNLRRPVANYSWDDADAARNNLLKKHAHMPLDECFRVINVINFEEDKK